MLVDATILMYGVFQSCRHSLHRTAAALNLLAETFEIVKQQGTLLMEVPDNWVTERQLQEPKDSLQVEHKLDYAISPANQKLFSLIYIGTGELKRLWASESTYAVRCLGYAFHNIPALLLKPAEFNAVW